MLINDELPVFVDKTNVGTISAKIPIRVKVQPGRHSIYASLPLNIIDRPYEFDIKAGEVLFFRVYFEAGFWVHSIYTVPTAPADHYESVIHILHDD